MYQYRNPASNTHIADNGSIEYRRTTDGHGGRAEEHRREMMQIAEQIAQQKIAEAVPEIQKAAYQQAYGNLIEALSFDVTSAVNVAFENGESIFRDSKTQTILANAVMQEIRKQLDKIK